MVTKTQSNCPKLDTDTSKLEPNCTNQLIKAGPTKSQSNYPKLDTETTKLKGIHRILGWRYDLWCPNLKVTIQSWTHTPPN